MNRTQAREFAVLLVFEQGFCVSTPQELLENWLDDQVFLSYSDENSLFAKMPDETQKEYISSVVLGVAGQNKVLEGYVEDNALGWKINRISRLALSVMKVCIFEMLNKKEIPPKVALNEAIEICKKYEDEDTVSFVNGVLGAVTRQRVDL